MALSQAESEPFPVEALVFYLVVERATSLDWRKISDRRWPQEQQRRWLFFLAYRQSLREIPIEMTSLDSSRLRKEQLCIA